MKSMKKFALWGWRSWLQSGMDIDARTSAGLAVVLQRKAYFLGCAATLTLVLGANAAMFAVVNATMLRPLPFATKGEIVHLFSQPPGTTGAVQRNPLQQMEVPRIRERVRTLARLEGYLLSERVITLNQEPAIAPTASVTTGLLRMMAARLAEGRTFLESEGQPGQFVAVISDRSGARDVGAGGVLALAQWSIGLTGSRTRSSASSRRPSRCRSWTRGS